MSFLKKFKEHREEKRKKQEKEKEFRKRAFWKVVNFIKGDKIDPRDCADIEGGYTFDFEDREVAISENFKWLKFGHNQLFLGKAHGSILKTELKDSIMRFENKEQQEMMKSS